MGTTDHINSANTHTLGFILLKIEKQMKIANLLKLSELSNPHRKVNDQYMHEVTRLMRNKE